MILAHAVVVKNLRSAAVRIPDMPRLFFKVSYDGTDYAGWQVQPDRMTVQEKIETFLEQLFVNQPIRLHASGRTDAGVHALGQGVTCDLPEAPSIPPLNIMKAMNHSLPPSIRILDAKLVEPDFHARFSAVGKVYTYVINNGVEYPFTARYSWHLTDFEDNDSLREVASVLEGTHDFAAFTTSVKKIDDSVRTIYKIDIRRFGDFIALSFIGSGFLYKMVRNLTGILALAGQGKITKEEVISVLLSKNRASAPKGAPPQALFLNEVFYSNAVMMNYELTSLPFVYNLL
jgi:tRNA pseudouridine38-40 synthase